MKTVTIDTFLVYEEITLLAKEFKVSRHTVYAALRRPTVPRHQEIRKKALALAADRNKIFQEMLPEWQSTIN